MAQRSLINAALSGLRNCCPNCGEGRVVHGYLKVVDRCSTSGE